MRAKDCEKDGESAPFRHCPRWPDLKDLAEWVPETTASSMARDSYTHAEISEALLLKEIHEFQ